MEASQGATAPVVAGPPPPPPLPPVQAESAAPSLPPSHQNTPTRPQGYGATAATPAHSAASSNSRASSHPGNSASPPISSRPQHAPSQNGPSPVPPPGPGQSLSSTLEKTPASTGLEMAPEYAELAKLLRQVSPQTVRQAVRDHWALCLLGSDYHSSFVLNALLHQANNAALDRAVHEFGQKMIRVSKRRIVEHMTAEDIDEVADVLLPKASDKFLDQALARRLETVPARQLVNALARAERLGYDVEDIVEDKSDSRPEHVYPSGQPYAPTTAAYGPGPQVLAVPAYPSSAPVPSSQPPGPYHGPEGARVMNHAMPLSSSQPAPGGMESAQHPSPHAQLPTQQPPASTPNGIQFCSRCGRPCSGPDALHYHMLKKACDVRATSIDRFNKDICPHCGVLFSSTGGLYYHKRSNVCGVYTPQRQAQLMEALTRPGQGVLPTQVPQHTMQKFHARQPAPPQTPNRPVSIPSDRTSTPSDDPYASLTPEARAEFNKEMAAVESHYGNLMREVVQSNLSKFEQEEELVKIKNRFNTKQSLTRKKYGIRLRTRRSKAQIGNDLSHAMATSTPTAANSSATTPHTVGAHSHKRPHPDGSQTPTTAPPAKRVPLSEMGGLSNQSATAEHVDPTTYLTPSKRQQVPHQQVVEQARPGASAADPMSVDENQSGENEQSSSSSESESESGSGEDDIPASLPASRDSVPAAQMN